MASKSPDYGDEGGQGGSSQTDTVCNLGGQMRGTRHSQAGDGCLGDKGGDSDDDDADGNRSGLNLASSEIPTDNEGLKKKPKKSKKKKRKNKAAARPWPPKRSLADECPNGVYAEGEIQNYDRGDQNTARKTHAEAHYDDRKYWEDESFLSNYRKGAEIHRQARQWVHDTVKPGQTLSSIAIGIEDGVRALLGNAGIEPGSCRKSGMGFPTGLCLNNQVAHYTPNPGQPDVVLKHEDVLTIDFGVHINGWIVDSAFTMAFDPTYDNLLAAVKDSTNTGIKTAGVDVRVSDVSAAIQETMESYEVEIGGKTFPVKPIRNLTGHNIIQNHIHGGKCVPMVKNNDQTKMEEGEVFAIETFGSTGRGKVYDDVGIYGYSLNEDAALHVALPMSSAKRLHKMIRENFGTIPFCRRYLERLGVDKYLAGMNCLVDNGIVEEYEPLADIKGSYSAQFEHTFLLRETHKEVFSRGCDY